MNWFDHLIIAPIIIPLVAGGLMLMFDGRTRAVAVVINLISTFTLLGVSIYLVLATAEQPMQSGGAIYRLGDWPAQFGIVLVVDRLSAMMVLLTSTVACAALVFSLARWHAAGSYFHPLFQFLVMGLNGAFLTGDLFNLFVFFEVFLAASYALALHGSGQARVRSGLHYVAINLASASVFLIGVSMIYGTAGTLNMADLAARIPALSERERALFEVGASILGIAFLVKSAMWPLGFWLPGTYAAAAAPVAAIFSIMTKVGIYTVLRLDSLLVDAATAGGGSGVFDQGWLLFGGGATILLAMVGMLASQDLPKLGSYAVMVSSGTLLAVIGVGNPNIIGGALYYLISSTLAISAFFLLIELVERGRAPADDILAVTLEAYGLDEVDEPTEDGEAGVAVPAILAVLGIAFMTCALLLAGLPPLSGFVAKFVILVGALSQPGETGGVVPWTGWALLALLLLSGFATLISMVRAGIRAFWASIEREVPRVRIIEFAPIAVLLLATVGITIYAAPVMNFVQDAAAGLHRSSTYTETVLSPASGSLRSGGEP